jgi:glutathione S-transferase
MLTLFTATNTCARACHIALAESGLAYQVKRVDFATKEQTSPNYLAINPKGRVPALVTDKGTLTEALAIMLFVAQSAPDKHLAPTDPFALAQMQAFNSYLASTVHINHAHGPRGSRWANEESSFADMKAKVPETMSACMTLIEKDMLKGPWVLGDTYSVADAYLFTICGWLATDKVDIKHYPKLNAHFEAMLARPAVQKALAEEKAA